MGQTAYTHTKTLTFPGMVARIFQPELTEEERKRRYKNIYTAAANLLKEVERNEKQKKNN
jgi:glycine cleavage system protein P-like pyridoxal-binding family